MADPLVTVDNTACQSLEVESGGALTKRSVTLTDTGTGGLSRHVKLAIAAFVLLLLGLVLSHPSQAWITRFYLSMQVITLVGYGDVVPTTDNGRLVFASFVLLVLVLFSYCYNVFRVWAARAAEDRRQRRLLRAEGAGVVTHDPKADLAQALLVFFVPILVSTVFFRYMEHCSCSFGQSWVGNPACPEEPNDIDFQTCAENGGQVKTWATSFYFSVITATTIGFGDFTAATHAGRWFMMLWMPVAIVSMGYFISKLSDAFFSQSEELEVDAALAMDRLHFDRIDIDKNGYLSRSEFYEYLMVKHGFVTQETMDVMRAKFDSMDVKGNDMVTWEELCASREQRLRDVAAAARSS